MKLRFALIIFGSLALMLGFQNCSPVQTSNADNGLVTALDNPTGNGNDSGSTASDAPVLPDDPQSVSDAVAFCTKGMDDGVKHIGNLGSQSGGYESYQIVSMGIAGSLANGERIFVGLPDTPIVNLIGSVSNSTLVICNLHVGILGSVSHSRVVLVNSQIDQIGAWSHSHVYYDSNTILGTVGSVSNSIMTKLK